MAKVILKIYIDESPVLKQVRESISENTMSFEYGGRGGYDCGEWECSREIGGARWSSDNCNYQSMSVMTKPSSSYLVARACQDVQNMCCNPTKHRVGDRDDGDEDVGKGLKS